MPRNWHAVPKWSSMAYSNCVSLKWNDPEVSNYTAEPKTINLPESFDRNNYEYEATIDDWSNKHTLRRWRIISTVQTPTRQRRTSDHRNINPEISTKYSTWDGSGSFQTTHHDRLQTYHKPNSHQTFSPWHWISSDTRLKVHYEALQIHGFTAHVQNFETGYRCKMTCLTKHLVLRPSRETTYLLKKKSHLFVLFV